MRKERVNCFTAGCNNCSRGVRVGKTFYWEEPLYSCSAFKRKHKKVDAEDCGQFRCNTPNDSPLCRDCRKGK